MLAVTERTISEQLDRRRSSIHLSGRVQQRAADPARAVRCTMRPWLPVETPEPRCRMGCKMDGLAAGEARAGRARTVPRVSPQNGWATRYPPFSSPEDSPFGRPTTRSPSMRFGFIVRQRLPTVETPRPWWFSGDDGETTGRPARVVIRWDPQMLIPRPSRPCLSCCSNISRVAPDFLPSSFPPSLPSTSPHVHRSCLSPLTVVRPLVPYAFLRLST